MSVDGLIRYYELVDWWQSDLTSAERERLELLYHPLGSSEARPLTEGMIDQIIGPSATVSGFLSSLIGWLSATPEDRVTRRKIREKLITHTALETNVIARHFSLQILIQGFYKDRDEDPEAKLAAIAYCRQQIAISSSVATAMKDLFPRALPRHVGYEQLAIILEKDRSFPEAVSLCEEAANGGWGGEWQKRIDRCRRRLQGAG